MSRYSIIPAISLTTLLAATLSIEAAEQTRPDSSFEIAQATDAGRGADDEDRRRREHGDGKGGGKGAPAAPAKQAQPPANAGAAAPKEKGPPRGHGERGRDRAGGGAPGGPPRAAPPGPPAGAPPAVKRQAQPQIAPAPQTPSAQQGGGDDHRGRRRDGEHDRGPAGGPPANPPPQRAQPAPPPAPPPVQQAQPPAKAPAPAAQGKDAERRARFGKDRDRNRAGGDAGRGGPPPGAAPPAPPTPPPAAANPPPPPPAAAGPAPRGPGGPPAVGKGRREFGGGPGAIDAIKRGRHQRVEDGGKRTIIEEPGNRTIVQEKGAPAMIRHDEGERMRRSSRDVRSERRPDGGNLTIAIRPGGIEVFSEFDSSGRLTRRYRRGRDGRETSLIDNRRFIRRGGPVILDLRPPVLHIPRERYIVDYDRASDEDIYETLEADPIERLDRGYSLEEVRYNAYLRDRMRRVDLDTVNFDFGAWEVPPDQYGRLERIANAINRMLDRHPDEVFLIEGHTDAVGSDIDNLTLSDRRAEEVAIILSETFNVPPENLVTQGYGEEFLKIPTLAAERINRRVAVRRITPLLARD